MKINKQEFYDDVKKLAEKLSKENPSKGMKIIHMSDELKEVLSKNMDKIQERPQ